MTWKYKLLAFGCFVWSPVGQTVNWLSWVKFSPNFPGHLCCAAAGGFTPPRLWNQWSLASRSCLEDGQGLSRAEKQLEVRVEVWHWWWEKGWMGIYGWVILGRLEGLGTYRMTLPHAVERKKPHQELTCFESQRMNMMKTISFVSPSLQLPVASDVFLLIW